MFREHPSPDSSFNSLHQSTTIDEPSYSYRWSPYTSFGNHDVRKSPFDSFYDNQAIIHESGFMPCSNNLENPRKLPDKDYTTMNYIDSSGGIVAGFTLAVMLILSWLQCCTCCIYKVVDEHERQIFD